MKLSNQSSILWVDCVGGLLVGMVVLSLATFISWLDSLPLAIVRFVGFANLAYGSYSLWLTTRATRKLSLIKILALANIAWLFVCIAIIVLHWDRISAFGVFHRLAEGFYVAALGFQEWRWRQKLAK